MTEYGKVVEKNDDFVKIRIKNCGKCDNCRVCDDTTHAQYSEISLKNTINADIDDIVMFEPYKTSTHVFSALCYLIPLILTVIAAAVSFRFSKEACAAFTSGAFIVGLAISLIVDFVCIRRLRGFKPALVEICCGRESEILAEELDNLD